MTSSISAHKPAHLITPLRLALRGHALLSSPRFNKGTGFPLSERTKFGLEGRLPYRTNTLEEQCERAYEQLMQRDTPIRKNTFLQSLKGQNWTLYYAVLTRHLRELVPVIYTPTEAEAISNYSHLFRKSEGLYLSFPDQDRMEDDFLEQTRGREIDLFVCTDSEAILGIGDQGVGGIGISTAKSVIYTLIGGMDPSRSLSVVLDVGTNNTELLNDPLYVGWPEKRVIGGAYDKFIDKFVQLVRKFYPHSLLHFEDFGVRNANRLLHKYRDTHAVFNDDIQGTGAVALACVMAAINVNSHQSKAKTTESKLSDQRYVIFGAGSAGMGIAVQLRDAMVTADGISREEANQRFWMVDREGLLYERDVGIENIGKYPSELIRSAGEGWGASSMVVQGGSNRDVGLLEVVERVKPTVLIGCSTAPGTFTKEVVQTMMRGLEEEDVLPIIMPLSNPSRLVEAKPADILLWTNGRALVATGSPFGTVKMDVGGEEKEFVIAECNNALIYPGIGFGAILSQSRIVTDTMLIEGAKRLASLSPAIQATANWKNKQVGQQQPYKYNGEALLPDFGIAPGVNFEVGIAVAEQAVKEGNSGLASDDDAVEQISVKAKEKVWVPVYPEYVYDAQGMEE
ncbi:Aminoacid dehydrogenase-like protein [Phlegmacium glaucopus]|nr:Aminoacid dehydrogenase-like protein [Phlegmacium glaucopus]